MSPRLRSDGFNWEIVSLRLRVHAVYIMLFWKGDVMLIILVFYMFVFRDLILVLNLRAKILSYLRA